MKKKWIIRVAVLLAILSAAVFFLFPHAVIGFDEPITAIKVIIASNGTGEINDVTYDYTATDDEYGLIIDCLNEYSYRCSVGTLRSIFSLKSSNSSGMEGNDAGYWVNIYLDTEAERHTIICGGTGEVMIDDIVYRIGYFRNDNQLELMNTIYSIVTRDEIK